MFIRFFPSIFVYPKHVIVKNQVIIMPKDTYSPEVVRRNEDFTAVSFILLHGKNNEKSEEQDIVINI